MNTAQQKFEGIYIKYKLKMNACVSYGFSEVYLLKKCKEMSEGNTLIEVANQIKKFGLPPKI